MDPPPLAIFPELPLLVISSSRAPSSSLTPSTSPHGSIGSDGATSAAVLELAGGALGRATCESEVGRRGAPTRPVLPQSHRSSR
jgi:hypothetical protein